MDAELRALRARDDYHAHAQLTMRMHVLYRLARSDADYDEFSSLTVLATDDEEDARRMAHDFSHSLQATDPCTGYCVEWLRAPSTPPLPIDFDNSSQPVLRAYFEAASAAAGSTCERIWLEPGVIATYYRAG